MEATSSQGCGRLSGLSVRREKFFLTHESSSLIHDAYEVEMQPLGEGSFGIVYRARMRGARDVVRAVKAVRKRSIAAESMVRAEIAILRRLDHPHICRLLETFEEAKIMYLVMEYVDGQVLFDYIRESSLRSELYEGFAAQAMRQVWGALHYCHERNVVHRDLKPENIMVQDASGPIEELQIKLIDFGLATLVRRAGGTPRKGAALAGTFAYMAPEAREPETRSQPRPPSDCWSSGMVLHALLLGGLPPEAVRCGSQTLDVGSPDYQGVSRAAKELLSGLLETDAKRRLTACEATASAWARGGASAAPHSFEQSLNALVRFHRSTMLQRAVLTALSMQMTGKHIADLSEQFLKLDRDGNGHISREELRAIADGSSGASSELVDWVDSVFDSIDTDGSSQIEYTEWLAAALQGDREMAEQTILAAFRVFDVDGSGKVDQKEIARVLTQSPTDIAALMPQFDRDGDGELDFEEFRQLIQGVQPPAEPETRERTWSESKRSFRPAVRPSAKRPTGASGTPSVCEVSGPARAAERVGSVRPCGAILNL